MCNKHCQLVSKCFVAIIVLIIICVAEATKQPVPAVFVISFDGFRNEYLNRNLTPYINQLRLKHTYSDYMYNVFPTKTFTNHHSIATGLYPSKHGVMNNQVFDLRLKRTLPYGYELFHYNEDIWPIYTLTEKSGKHAGCMMWPGSNFTYANTSCTHSTAHNHTTNWLQKIDEIMTWFKDPEKPASLVMLYNDQPDFNAHIFSPNSPLIDEMIVNVDNLVKYVEESLLRNNLTNTVNVIYLSDHGMDTFTSETLIDLRKYVDNGTTYDMYGISPIVQIEPKPGKENDVYEKLQAASKSNGHFKIYKLGEFPERWHCENIDRMGPIVAVADLHYGFDDVYLWLKKYQEQYNVTISPSTVYGLHGWDNAHSTMQSFFMATGPMFKTNNFVDPPHSVDLYNLIATIIGVVPRPNDGSVTNFGHLLLKQSKLDVIVEKISSMTSTQLTVLIIFFVVLLVFATYLVITFRRQSKSDRYNVDNAPPEDFYLRMDDDEYIL